MTCTQHESHTHVHKAGCGHKAVKHDGHVDYLHDGHMHHVHEGHIDEHQLSGAGDCKNGHSCSSHETGHRHGPNCGHEAVPHGTHKDYWVNGHLHGSHENHCDNHGALVAA